MSKKTEKNVNDAASQAARLEEERKKLKDSLEAKEKIKKTILVTSIRTWMYGRCNA